VAGSAETARATAQPDADFPVDQPACETCLANYGPDPARLPDCSPGVPESAADSAVPDQLQRAVTDARSNPPDPRTDPVTSADNPDCWLAALQNARALAFAEDPKPPEPASLPACGPCSACWSATSGLAADRADCRSITQSCTLVNALASAVSARATRTGFRSTQAMQAAMAISSSSGKALNRASRKFR